LQLAIFDVAEATLPHAMKVFDPPTHRVAEDDSPSFFESLDGRGWFAGWPAVLLNL
jgi:hypothetical protein